MSGSARLTHEQTRRLCGQKRQRQQHEDIWNLYIQACGGKCCACGSTDQIQRGHIQRHADAGGDALENLIPICKACNARHAKTDTPDTRPADWRSAFVRLVIQHFRLEIIEVPRSGPRHLDSDFESGENRKVIPLEAIKFEVNSKYLPSSSAPPSSPTQDQVTDTTDRLILAGRKRTPRIPPPRETTAAAMRRLVRVHGIQTFLDAGHAFLDAGDWYEDSGDLTIRTMPKGQEWERFCENFSLYRKLWRERQVREAREAAEQQRLAEEQRRKEEAQRQLEQSPEYIAEQEAVQEKYRQEAAQRKRKIRLLPLRAAFDKLCAEIDKGDGIDDGETDRIDTWHRITDLLNTMMDCAESELVQHEAEFNRLMDDLKYPQSQPACDLSDLNP